MAQGDLAQWISSLAFFIEKGEPVADTGDSSAAEVHCNLPKLKLPAKSTFCNIYYQNTRRLRTKTSTFYENPLLEEYDIIGLTETWLCEGIHTSELFDERYTVVRKTEVLQLPVELDQAIPKYTKNLSADKINLSTFKGEGELSNLELDEIVLTDLLELPCWLRLTRAWCNKVTFRIPWTKLRSVPIYLVELGEALKKMTKLNEELNELNKINKEMLTSIETLSEQNLANLKEIEVMKQENCSLELKMTQKSKREDQPKPVSPRKNRDGKISNRKTQKENKTYAASCEALRNFQSLTDVELKEGRAAINNSNFSQDFQENQIGGKIKTILM
ncbi:hypothetical protein JTB14_027410 [Gonioctena quinquepunctata]|nr:hypothetical protein JTB14_027410 [Gonioctena quinquepunctata]